MQDLIEFKTPSGYVFKLKPEMTYGEFMEIQKVVTAGVDFDMAKQQMGNFSASALFEAQKKSIEIVVKSGTNPDGKEITNLVKAVNDLPRKDGEVLMAKINELTQETAVDEKKRGN